MTPTTPAPATAEHGMTARICDFDWASTPLGPREAWPVSLRAVTGPLLDHPLPMIVLWSLELLQIYDDGYSVVMGDKHPAGLNQGNPVCWPEVWGFNAPIFGGVLTRSFPGDAFWDAQMSVPTRLRGISTSSGGVRPVDRRAGAGRRDTPARR